MYTQKGISFLCGVVSSSKRHVYVHKRDPCIHSKWHLNVFLLCVVRCRPSEKTYIYTKETWIHMQKRPEYAFVFSVEMCRFPFCTQEKRNTNPILIFNCVISPGGVGGGGRDGSYKCLFLQMIVCRHISLNSGGSCVRYSVLQCVVVCCRWVAVCWRCVVDVCYGNYRHHCNCCCEH